MTLKKTGPRVERRRSARADATLSMRVEGRPQDGDLTQIVTESQNISASGVYCTSPHYLAPLSKVALTIVLPQRGQGAGATSAQRLLKCDGVVVRCQPALDGPRRQSYDLACSFIALDDRHRGLIEEFVTWRGLEGLRRGVEKAARTKTRRRTTARKVKTAARPRAKAAARRTASTKTRRAGQR